MRPFSRAAVLASVFLCVFSTSIIAEQAPPAGVKDYIQTFSEPALYGEDPWVMDNETRALHRWLMQDKAALEPVGITVNAAVQDLSDIGVQQSDSGLPQSAPRRYRVGVTLDVGLDVDFSTLPSFADSAPFLNGVAHKVSDGIAWTLPVHAPDATGMRVRFENFDLPAGTAVYVYNVHGDAFGPYSGRGPNHEGEFWSHTVFGEKLMIEFRAVGKINAGVLDGIAFEIADIAYLGSRFKMPSFTNPAALGDKGTLCSFNESCVENADDYGTGDWAAINDARAGVALMLFQSGRYFYLCSGGLLADTDTSTQVPLFLTANHCISKGREASSLEAFWGYRESVYMCQDFETAGVPRTLGSSILSKNRTSDYTLLQLDEQPPGGSMFLGWTSAPVAFDNGTDLYRISHPSGAPQAFSTHDVDTGAGTCGSWPRGNWIYSRDVVGATEGGSSGSPVANSTGQVVGQLSGACGTNLDDVCDAVNNATVDGALAAYFDDVSEWLDPDSGPPGGGGDMHVDSIDLGTQTKGRRTRGVATVTIVDENGAPISGADVTGSFSGGVSGTKSGTTGTDGVAEIRSNWTRNSVSGFQFCVDSVSHASLGYDSVANVETCDSF